MLLRSMKVKDYVSQPRYIKAGNCWMVYVFKNGEQKNYFFASEQEASEFCLKNAV